MNLKNDDYIQPITLDSDFIRKYSIVEQIITKYDYKSNTIKVILVVFLILILQGLHMGMNLFFLIPIKRFFYLTEMYLLVLTGIYFLSIAIGSYLTSYLTHKFSRIDILNCLLLLISILQFSLGFNNNVIIYGILKFIIGISLGITLIIPLNILTEYLPMRRRSIFLTGIWIGFYIGHVLFLLIILIIMPKYQLQNFKLVMFICSSLSIFSLIICYCFLQDSPRNLIYTRKNSEALNVLEKLYGKKLKEKDTEAILNTYKPYIDIYNSFEGMFLAHDMYKTTYLLMLIWTINSLILYGPFLTSSNVLKQIGFKPKSTYDMISSQFIIILIRIIANLIGPLITEVSFLGRTKTGVLGLTIAFLMNIYILLYFDRYEILFSFYCAVVSIVYYIVVTYTCEIYNTKVRDKAVGLFFSISNMIGFISQFIYIFLDHLGKWIPYYFSCFLILIEIYLILLLPIETNYRFIDEEELELDIDILINQSNDSEIKCE